MYPPDDSDSRELFEERAAIMQYDGGMPRYQAEFYATVAAHQYCALSGAEPPNTDYYRIVTRHMSVDHPREPGEAVGAA